MNLFFLSLAFPFIVQANALERRATSFAIAQNYSGQAFFDGWNYQEGIDFTNWGNVLFQSGPDAAAQKLAYVNDKGNAIIKVDNTTVGVSDTYGRASVLMSSQASFNQGNLLLFSATHMPYGCSVWPGFWTLGGDSTNWPLYGEIDIVENVNLAANNQYSLHTERGCTHPPATTGVETGRVGQNDCWNGTAYNSGCIVAENKPNNYGAGFAANGGGAYAVLWDDTGIKFWFFPRAEIPADFSTASPTPTNWGLPSAFYPQSSCNTTQFFGPQSIIIEIDICGLYAGQPGVYGAGGLCQGLCTDLVKDPKNYDNAYFEIEYLRVFAEENDVANGTVSTPIPSSTTTTGGSTPTNPSNANGPSNGAGVIQPLSLSWYQVTSVFVALCMGLLVSF